MKSIIKNALILMTITLTAGVSLGAVHAITEEPVAAQEKKKKEDASKAFLLSFKQSLLFNPPYKSINLFNIRFIHSP